MRKYDDECKQAAVKNIHDGQPVASVARELGITESLLHKWKRQVTASSSDADKETLSLKLLEGRMFEDVTQSHRLAVHDAEGACQDERVAIA